MSAVLFSLLAVLALGLGARDQLTLAAMTRRRGPRPAFLIVALSTGLGSMALAVWAAQAIAAAMPAPARLLFAALALGIGGLEMLLRRQASEPLEPTDSLGAFAIVLLAQQVTDASRFTVFALALATHAPIGAVLGGAGASAILALLGWLAADMIADRDWIAPRRVMGIAILLGAMLLALRALSAP